MEKRRMMLESTIAGLLTALALAGCAPLEADGVPPDWGIRRQALTGSTLFQPAERYWVGRSQRGLSGQKVRGCWKHDPQVCMEFQVQPLVPVENPATACFAQAFRELVLVSPVPEGNAEDWRIEGLEDLSEPRPVISSSAALLPYLGSGLRSYFLGQLVALDRLPVGRPTPVPVAVLDTLNSQCDPGGDASKCGGHGWTMGGIIRELACPEGDAGPCAAEVGYFQALDPRTQTGNLIQLTWAICTAVEAWQANEPPQPPLILNLSLGWEPAQPPALLSETVKRALEYATCHGALPLAAAGNWQVKEEPRGPLLPAGWAIESADCEQFHDAAVAGTVPLVYAVGAVDADNRPLAVSRPQGIPERVAFGLQGTSRQVAASQPDVTPDWQYSDVLTGTSVATAAAAALAAVIGAYQPQAGPAQIMAWLDQGGLELERSADFAYVGSPTAEVAPPPVRRLRLCQALRAACGQGGGACPSTLPNCREPSSKPPGCYERALESFLRDHPGATRPALAPKMEACGSQPPILGCGGCFATSRHIVLDILSNFPGNMQDSRVEAWNGTSWQTLLSPEGPLQPGQVYIRESSLEGAQAARLTYSIGGETRFEQIGLGY